jgi:hypothetical protein
MSATRLHKLTAVLFAVLYGVVGFTGESLHYLLTDPTLLWSSAQSTESAVFYHTHGPDYHGHFHRHSHHGPHSHAVGTADHDAGQQTGAFAFKSDASSHEAHACPLLVLVSTLKLGQAGSCATTILLDSLVSPRCECYVVRQIDVSFDSFARGPPIWTFA